MIRVAAAVWRGLHGKSKLAYGWESSSRKSCGARADGAGTASLHVWTRCEKRGSPPGVGHGARSAPCPTPAGLLEGELCFASQAKEVPRNSLNQCKSLIDSR